MKDSFILYTEQKETFESLSDEQAGKLIKEIFEYIETGQEPNLDGILKIAFIPIRQSLDRNNDKWEDIKQKRSLAGKKSAELKKQQKVTNLTSVDFVKNKTTNSTVNVNVNDNVNVNVNDNVNIKEKINKKEFAEFVTMTNAEYDKLISTYGTDFTNECIKVLDNYKGANGKKYKSDYRAILNWVVDRVKSNQPKKQSKGNHIDFRDL